MFVVIRGMFETGSPPYNGKYTLDPEGLWFFHSSDASENSAGFVKKIQLWNRALSDSDVRDECGCELPANGKACKYSNTYVPTYLLHLSPLNSHA